MQSDSKLNLELEDLTGYYPYRIYYLNTETNVWWLDNVRFELQDILRDMMKLLVDYDQVKITYHGKSYIVRKDKK